MPYERPGAAVYVKNTTGGIILHNAPVVLEGIPGIASKQVPAHWSDGLTAQNQIQINEPFVIRRGGVRQVADGGAGFVDGDLVYITSANVLTKTATSNTRFGKVVEVPGDGRGVPAGMVRVNLDERFTPGAA